MAAKKASQKPMSEDTSRPPDSPGQRLFSFEEVNMPKTQAPKKGVGKPPLIKLPVSNIVIELNGPDADSGYFVYEESQISSDLKCSDCAEETELWGAYHGIENMVLAHAVAGVNVKDKDYLKGLEKAIEACRQDLLGI